MSLDKGEKNNMLICLMYFLGGIILLNSIVTIILDIKLLGVFTFKKSKGQYPSQFMITQENPIDIQKDFECSAYASAYLLRHFGKEASGEAIYKVMPNKMKDGCVYPKGILNFMRTQGFEFKYYRGNIETLKEEVSKGVPVIVFIKVFKNKKWLHYVPVIGYDEENIYIAESLENLINTSSENYNRKVTIKDFKKLWKTNDFRIPFYKYTYIAYDHKIEEI